MGVITGLTDLDYILDGGLQKGCLYVLAARPAMGKTGMAITMVDHICLNQYRTVLYFSLDTSKRQIIDRIVALESEIDPNKIRKGDIDGEDWNRVAQVAKRMSRSRLIVEDAPGLDVQKIKSKCLEYRKDGDDYAVIFIDYLQLILGSSEGGSREKDISEIIKSLKMLAGELDRPIVALSQISRKPEYRKDHRPILSDFVAGKVICQYADGIMFLYRDEYYNEHSERKGIADVIVAKNSNGPVGAFELGFQPRFIRFENRHVC